MPNPLDLHLAGNLPRAASREPRDAPSRECPRAPVFASLLFCAICTSCGAVGSGSPAPLPVTVSIAPTSAQTYPGNPVPFSASVQNAANTAVTWQVNGTNGGSAEAGTITSTGLSTAVYTAPNSVPNPPTVTVTAIWQSDASKTGSSSVTILSLSAVTAPLVVSPALASLTTSQTLQFNILTPGVSNTDVSWAASGGTITPGGLFTPPSTLGAYTIQASLPNVTGTATVEVIDFPGVLTWRNDNSRSGVNGQEMVLSPGPSGSPGAVSSSTFGKLFSCPIDGAAYAQPLYVPNLAIPGMGTHNVIFAATENDSVYAFDADANPCVQLWQTSLIPAGSQPISNANMNIATEGITGTPATDGNALTLYVVAASQVAAVNPTYSQQLFALDLKTVPPAIQPVGAGVDISTPTSVFDPSLQNQRAALLLANGTVYIAFGSNGLSGDYHGWLFAYDATTLQQTGVFDVTQPPAVQGGIWQSGGGPSADSNGNVFVVTGDGLFNADRTSASYSYGDSFLRFGLAEGLSSVADYFTPCDQATLQSDGLDVGASAPVLLPASAGSPSEPDLLIGGSKGGSLYVVNRDNMGGYAPTPCPELTAPAQTIPVGAGPIMSTPLFWNNAIYVAPGNGTTMNGYLMSFPLSAPGMFAFTPSTSQSPETLGPYGATPVISWNQTNNDPSTAILWLIDSSGALASPTNTPAILRAYDANNLSIEIYNSTMAANSRDTAGAAVKFTVPTVANGKVYVGTQTELDVYGLLQ